jgi:hypothetical protein
MFSFFKKKKKIQNPEIESYISLIKQIDLAILDKGLRPHLANSIVVTGIYTLSETIRKVKYVNTLFDTEVFKYTSILNEKKDIPYYHYIGHSFENKVEIREQLLLLFDILIEFLTRYEIFLNKETLNIVDQNKSRLFSLVYIQTKDLINSLVKIGNN